MRLIHTVERYAPAIGGAERVVQRVAEGLAARGHEVIVVTSGMRASERLNGVRVERFPVGGNDARGIRGDAGTVLEFVDELAPDLVFSYAAQTWHADTFGARADLPRPYRLVLAPCGFSRLRDPDFGAYFERLRGWLPRYDALVFHSRSYQDFTFATEAGTPDTLMHVIPNAADDPLPRRGHDGPETLFVTVGSHVRSKGHADFIEAVRAMGKRTASRGIVVAPARRGLDWTRGCQPRCSLESVRPGGAVRFLDGRRQGAVQHVLAEADVFVFPSRIECAPIVILEAMAAGVPWVSYDVGNVRELAGGIVVDGFDELVEASARLAQAPEERERHGEAGRRAWREHHRWPDVIDAYERLFLELVRP